MFEMRLSASHRQVCTGELQKIVVDFTIDVAKCVTHFVKLQGTPIYSYVPLQI